MTNPHRENTLRLEMPARAERKPKNDILPVTKERRMLPYPHVIHLNEEEMVALQLEAHKIQGLLDVLESKRKADGSWTVADGAAFIEGSFRDKGRFFVDAFRNMNRTDVSPGAISVVRTDFVEIDGGKIRPDKEWETYHVTSGGGVGLMLTYIDMYHWFCRLFYTNIQDDRAREAKQNELLGIFKDHPNIVISMSHEVFESRRSQASASG